MPKCPSVLELALLEGLRYPHKSIKNRGTVKIWLNFNRAYCVAASPSDTRDGLDTLTSFFAWPEVGRIGSDGAFGRCLWFECYQAHCAFFPRGFLSTDQPKHNPRDDNAPRKKQLREKSAQIGHGSIVTSGPIYLMALTKRVFNRLL